MVNPGGLGPTNMPFFKSHEYAIDYDAMLFFTTWEKYVGQKYLPKNKYFFASFNNDRGLNSNKTKDCVDRNTGGLVYSLHEVTQLG